MLAGSAPAALADAVLFAHAALVLAVVGLLPLVWLGGRRGWAWVRWRPLRLAHLATIGLVVVQAWLGWTCPLTLLEDALRAEAGLAVSEAGFIARWVHRLLYHPLPPIIFVLAYSAFGAAVAWTWWRVPPRRRGEPADAGAASGRRATWESH
ncbi:DUF2784 domain-containing protein [Piscinibacter sakaiensis]